MEPEEIKERERICNLSRDGLIRLIVSEMQHYELYDYVMISMDEDTDYTDDDMRHDLLKNL